MSIWVKICGNTTREDAQLAVETGADAVGFVFAASPRRVTVKDVAGIVPHLPVATEKIGVFVDAGFDEVETAVNACGLTGVQLHREGGADLPEKLRARFGSKLRILRVVHFGAAAMEQMQAASADVNVDGILVDSRTATAVGGTGIAYDWEQARATIFKGRNTMKMVAAGGLNPENVAQAIATLKPWGVDVVSGVEAAPGRKDPAKVRDFVARARAASRS